MEQALLQDAEKKPVSATASLTTMKMTTDSNTSLKMEVPEQDD